MKGLWTLTLLMLSLWTAPRAQAQPQRLRFEHLGVEQGLVQGTVYTIMQDRQGFLWIATEGGLNRYDGHTFETYTATPFDTTSLSNNILQSVTEAENGDLWVATMNAGLNRVDRATGRFTHYRHDLDDASSLSSDRTYHTLEDRRGDLWVTTLGGGLNRMRAGQDGRFTHYRHDPDDASSLSHDRLYELSEDAEGHIWAGSVNGVNRIDPKTETITRFLYDPESTRGYGAPHNIFAGYVPPEEPGILWLTTGNGLIRLHTRTGAHERFLIEPEREGQPNPLNRIRQVVPDPLDPDVLWAVGPGTGVARFDRRTGQFTSYRNDPRDPHSLPNNYALSLLADRSGTLWVGTGTEGLSRFNPGALNFTHLQHDPDNAQSLAPDIVWGLYEDRGGTLWVGTDGHSETYLTQFDAVTGRVTRHRHDPNDPATLPPGTIRDFAEDAAGQLWVGARGGLGRMDRATGRVTRYLHDGSTPEEQQRNDIWEVLTGRSDAGVLWVGSMGGLDRFDTRTGRFTPIPLELEDRAPFVGTLHEDAGGILWAGTREGLFRIDPSGGGTPLGRLVSAYDARDTTAISTNSIQGIAEREREPGILWLSTSGGGLNRFDTKSSTARHFTTEDGLPSNVLYGILEDEAGTLWMSTNGGISNFDPETETFTDVSLRFRNYGLDDGLIALEYNTDSYARGAGGKLYFGSGQGVTVFTPERLHTNAVPPQVALTGFRLFNEPVAFGPDSPLKKRLADTEQITLTHDQNEVAFDFVALHFANPAENRYAYRLEGFDRDWVDSGTDRTATYTNLPPGRYTFRVKAANSDGVWNEEGTAVGLTVLPPWWRTWWAYLGYVLLFIGVVVAVDRVQRRRLREVERRRAAGREARLRAELAEERTQYLEALDQARSRFFANVSHEFRTPLTLLLGPLQDALDRDDPEQAAERLMQQVPSMHRNAGRLLRLVGQLLDLTKLEAGSMNLHPRRIDLTAFLRDLVPAFAPLAERDGLTLLFDTEHEALWGSADPDKLEKIVSNLLTNAIKFTMRGGKVRVGLTATGDGAGFTLTVSDTGRGIPADELPHVFDRFHQVDGTTTREHEGTGLGLALVKELVELHGGTIEVESQRGFGTTFTVWLPLEAQGMEAQAAAPTTGQRVPAGRSAGTALEIASLGAVASAREIPTCEIPPVEAGAAEGTVLVVDDNADVRAFVCSHLTAHYHVLEAADGEAGLALIRRCHPDLVISDVMMPKLDGYALCRAVKADAELRHIPVILLTAKAEKADRIHGLEGGADDYLTKPFSMRELEVRVTNLILSRAHLRSAYSGMLQVPQAGVVIPSGEEAFMQQVLEVMNRHLGDSNFSTDWLAGEVSLSRRQVERKVKTLTKQTPPELMQQMRLERAAQILEARPGSIAEVAYAVGFKSPAHFSVVFRRAYGHTPSEHIANAP